MTEKNKEMVCGSAFEDLSEEEMMDVDGGTAGGGVVEGVVSIATVTTLPCGVGASIGCAGVGIWWYTTHH